MFTNILTFISDHSYCLCLICAAEADAQHHIKKQTIWQLTNEQSDSSQIPISQHTEENNRQSLRLSNWTWTVAHTHTHTQPHHKHINIGRIHVHMCLFHTNRCSNQIHNINNQQNAHQCFCHILFTQLSSLCSGWYYYYYKIINVQMLCCVATTPSQLKIIIISDENI